ncbi:hypothetical protein MMC20_007665 [Loxospora ochrophaea]|nr:hypothetical protein [Loxospora ochrophaea]
MAERKIRLAVEGCGHGTLHAIYASVAKSCEMNGWDGVDLVIVGGDFQAVRNSYDLNCMSVPRKYLQIGDFHEYYSGSRTAPYLTLFIGGNHEASNYLWELYYGGWVAPNIYYLGAANIIRLGPLRIAGLSGIWKGYNYNKPHHERLPFSQDDIKSIYHVREIDVRKLMQISTQVDVGLSHDWPRGVEWMGDWKTLFRKKDLFEADARAGTLGSVAAKKVMDHLRPPYWFSAHLHVKFAAIVKYDSRETDSKSNSNGPTTATSLEGKNADEIDLDMDDAPEQDARPDTKPTSVYNDDEIALDSESDSGLTPAVPQPSKEPLPSTAPLPPASTVPDSLRAQLPSSFARPTSPPPLPPHPPEITNTTTRFLALDKCLPHRSFLQLLEISPISTPLPSPSPPSTSSSLPRPLTLSYDPEYLSITRAFALPPLSLSPLSPIPPQGPSSTSSSYNPHISASAAWVQTHIVAANKLTIPQNFERTAEPYDPSVGVSETRGEQAWEKTNPQTVAFCELLGIGCVFEGAEGEREERRERRRMQGDDGGGGSGGGRGGWRGGGRGRGRGGGGGRRWGRGRG